MTQSRHGKSAIIGNTAIHQLKTKNSKELYILSKDFFGSKCCPTQDLCKFKRNPSYIDILFFTFLEQYSTIIVWIR